MKEQARTFSHLLYRPEHRLDRTGVAHYSGTFGSRKIRLQAKASILSLHEKANASTYNRSLGPPRLVFFTKEPPSLRGLCLLCL
jgi:hypothetical protein